MNYDESETGGFMFRGIIQAACILAIAIGAGLFGFGQYLQPDVEVNLNNPGTFVRQWDMPEHMRFSAAASTGAGIGFMTLGGLGLTVPWLNVLLNRQRDPSDPAPVDRVGASA